jgi:hypothetical protein
MAELSRDLVFRIAFAELRGEDRRLLERVLSTADGVTAFDLGADGILVVSVNADIGDISLTRAFAAAGILPESAERLGGTHMGGMNAC